ncbi:MAG: hypothetical protein IJB96_01425 [Lachnospira sp.]|nr:hypothetical protein [Lachnospira sp.]
MLGKLIKWEFRANAGLFFGMYFFALICAALSNIAGAIREKTGNGTISIFFSSTCMIMTLLAIVAMFAVIVIVSVTRYYDNLVKDQGYLMHTIPVKPWQLHITKLIVPMVWLAGAVLVALLSVTAATRTMFSFSEIFDTIFRSEDSSKIIGLIGYMIVAVISGFSIFYVCINLGSLSATSKGLMGFVSYIVIYFINQALNLVAMVVAMLIVFSGEADVWAVLNSDVPPNGFIEATFVAAGIVSVICIVVYNLISMYILKNKVNLE